MSEREPVNGSRFRVSEADVVENLDLTTQYFEERVAAKEAGEPVWIAMGFKKNIKSKHGPVLKHFYFREDRYFGYIHGAPGMGYISYRLPVDDEIGHQRLTMELVPEEAAKRALVDYIDFNFLRFED